jgi:hypothetical protein
VCVLFLYVGLRFLGIAHRYCIYECQNMCIVLTLLESHKILDPKIVRVIIFHVQVDNVCTVWETPSELLDD